jgi:surfactin synthase thioesterase subunit
MGYIVIWVEYDSATPARNFASKIISDYQAASKEITTDRRTYVHPATDELGNVINVLFGHSAGAFLSFPVAAMVATPGKRPSAV